jgi:NAD(P)-dependent dehydrogenase (short-subunit alcohol dehydrogenase family)
MIVPVLLEVTSAESIDGALASVGDHPLAGLFNNAGMVAMGPVELLSVEAWRRQFEVNVIGLVAGTSAVRVAGWRRRSSSRRDHPPRPS